ncbi:MAG: diadenylate cyclase, partial [Fimbriimonadaceae bacterium]|nr:diadenylate cyclase [Fimbriimonadaceae bacterium]
MGEALQRLGGLFSLTPEALISVIDILLVAFLTYRLLRLVSGTRAWKLLIGVAVFAGALFLSDLLQLRTLHWLLERATILAPVALVILLLPELRAALEGFGKIGLLPEKLFSSDPVAEQKHVRATAEAVRRMAESNTGALIVFERSERLDEVEESGVPMDAQISSALMETIFFEGNPLHDGAVLIRNGRLVAAACRLPLSENPSLDPNVHMRHRAGVGVTESSDCV